MTCKAVNCFLSSNVCFQIGILVFPHVTKSPRLPPFKPLLISLHWLPIYSKIALITYNIVRLDQPTALRQLLTFQASWTCTPSQNPIQLLIPFAKCFARKSFSHVPPTVWNRITFNIRNASNVLSFRRQL